MSRGVMDLGRDEQHRSFVLMVMPRVTRILLQVTVCTGAETRLYVCLSEVACSIASLLYLNLSHRDRFKVWITIRRVSDAVVHRVRFVGIDGIAGAASVIGIFRILLRVRLTQCCAGSSIRRS
jgi:hypothetical protein